jgi:hypothetical protein
MNVNMMATTNNNNNSMRTKINRVLPVPIFRRSFILCLLLLLSISSATDSFQQQQHVSSRIRRTSTSSIAAVGVYGGAITEPYISPSPTDNPRERRSLWNIISQQRREKQQRRRKRRRKALPLDDEEYQRRKAEWADRYATLDGLRETFGSNQNKFFGDLDIPTTRKLYKSLLPTAVCELVLDVDVRPEELAPLAFEARKAAKLYARERCHVPARWLANFYDGYRQYKTYGQFQIEGMSYDQVWDKYYQRSTLERSTRKRKSSTSTRHDDDDDNDYDEYDDGWTEQDIVAQTCMKILESSCRTNPLIDQMTLEKRGRKQNKRNGKRRSMKIMNENEECDLMDDDEERENLEKIALTLEEDVRKLLDPYNNNYSNQ